MSGVDPPVTLYHLCVCVCVSADNCAAGNAVAAEKTQVESVELVLPTHANHQVDTDVFYLSTIHDPSRAISVYSGCVITSLYLNTR